MNKIYPASLNKLHEMLSFIQEQANELGFDVNLSTKIELAVEEAIVNIIKHGYPHDRGILEIKCSVPQGREGLQIELRDEGKPFNPLSYVQTIDVEAPLELRPLGGYGIYLILKIMDHVEYKREGSSNVLILTKLAKSENLTPLIKHCC